MLIFRKINIFIEFRNILLEDLKTGFILLSVNSTKVCLESLCRVRYHFPTL